MDDPKYFMAEKEIKKKKKSSGVVKYAKDDKFIGNKLATKEFSAITSISSPEENSSF